MRRGAEELVASSARAVPAQATGISKRPFSPFLRLIFDLRPHCPPRPHPAFTPYASPPAAALLIPCWLSYRGPLLPLRVALSASPRRVDLPQSEAREGGGRSGMLGHLQDFVDTEVALYYRRVIPRSAHSRWDRFVRRLHTLGWRPAAAAVALAVAVLLVCAVAAAVSWTTGVVDRSHVFTLENHARRVAGLPETTLEEALLQARRHRTAPHRSPRLTAEADAALQASHQRTVEGAAAAAEGAAALLKAHLWRLSTALGRRCQPAL